MECLIFRIERGLETVGPPPTCSYVNKSALAYSVCDHIYQTVAITKVMLVPARALLIILGALNQIPRLSIPKKQSPAPTFARGRPWLEPQSRNSVELLDANLHRQWQIVRLRSKAILFPAPILLIRPLPKSHRAVRTTSNRTLLTCSTVGGRLSVNGSARP